MPFIASVERHAVHRLASTAVYPVADVALVPQALLRNLKHNQVLHERNIILTVHFAEVPHLPGSDRRVVERLGGSFWQASLRLGFTEVPDVPAALRSASSNALEVPVFETTFFLSRETVVPTAGAALASACSPP